MGAQEQHGGFAGVGFALDFGQGLQALAGEAFGQQRQEVHHGCASGELVVGGVQESFDGLDTEGAFELTLQPSGGGLQRDLLVDGQIRVVVVGLGERAFGHGGSLAQVSDFT